jgi:predicted nucleotidyltransferase
LTGGSRSTRPGARRRRSLARRALGRRLLGVYLIGSLAHGGFNTRYSDIDMGLVTEDGVSPDEIEAMRDHARTLSPALAAKLSLFWSDRGFTIGRFPPLDRLDYLDHSQTLIEHERVLPPRPSLADVQTYLRGQPLEAYRVQIDRVTALHSLDDTTRKSYIRALLYPARFIYSWYTGLMASNDDAVAFLRERRPAGLDIDLIERALACRLAEREPDALFPEQNKLEDLFAACARLAADETVRS